MSSINTVAESLYNNHASSLIAAGVALVVTIICATLIILETRREQFLKQESIDQLLHILLKSSQ